MSYREDEAALRERIEALARELDEVRGHKRSLEAVSLREAELSREIDELRGRATKAARAASPRLEGMRIASPCDADWEAMTGDDKVRYCGSCRKNVYDLSAMTREAAEALIAEKEGKLCVRFAQRADGTVITDDCPVGVRQVKKRRLRVLAASVAVTAGATGAGLALVRSAVSVQMGKLEATEPPRPAIVEPVGITMGEYMPEPQSSAHTPPSVPATASAAATPKDRASCDGLKTAAPPPAPSLRKMGKPSFNPEFD